jgi:hypothetical protein
MPYRADIELAHLHLGQVEQKMEDQQARIKTLQQGGQDAKSAEDLLTVLSATRNSLVDFIRRTTPPVVGG